MHQNHPPTDDNSYKKELPSEELLTSNELARLWKISVQCLAQWRFRNKGPKYIKLESKVLYKRSDIEQYMEDHVTSPANEKSQAESENTADNHE